LSQPFTLVLGGPPFFVRTFALRDVDHGTHKLHQIARSVDHRMAYAMNVNDPFVWMNDATVQFEIYLVADGFLESFPALSLIVRMNPLNDGLYWRWGSITRGETHHAITLL
jgi:hypothetical protein